MVFMPGVDAIFQFMHTLEKKSFVNNDIWRIKENDYDGTHLMNFELTESYVSVRVVL